MKYLNLFIISLFLISCGSEPVDIRKLDFGQEKSGGPIILCMKDSSEKFNGTAVSHFMESSKIIEKTVYIDGVKSGVQEMWYEGGNKKSKSYWSRGKREGSQEEWYENGKKKLLVNWKEGKPFGEHNEWHETGFKWCVGQYKDGKDDGEWKYWDEKGKKDFINIWTNGNLRRIRFR